MQIIVSPHKKIYLDDEARQISALKDAFDNGSGFGLLALDNFHGECDETIIYWQNLTRLYLHYFSLLPNLDTQLSPPPIKLNEFDLHQILDNKPLMQGVEHLDEEYILFLWQSLEKSLAQKIKDYTQISGKNIAEFLAANHPNWNILGRVCFNLAETKNFDTPFAKSEFSSGRVN